ncbi:MULTISPECIES: NAD(P)H-dependent oxidoreductase [Priestia]|jgi:NAD(P)H dehydrogenase (quinone)|uniref:Flavodoxin family protein n=4 Tax=Priestia TaxID=2800373 RepID=A0A120EKI0_PRIMG|nr:MULTISPECIES: NAD(P)H-dependent oxidoreductase [Priestia]MBK0006983.1 NAD(P)H-dependent oxidoreductase [Bacillus sp. S35]MBK0291468.1 NAD(P)H-dependent oxidoreductase [Bacillus sp. S34]MBU8854212.1 NAD(P)H-dependent oxidoreductase [Bacillus sp. FJAT-26377]MCJ7992038.1 NAD(P)H-dependent oxidoreductase [Priestia sp. OVS21]MCL9633382.1 NAD(P)H-dependent oxidoreductase [Bacillus zanthoxyli]NHH93767.1 p-benzoquinone reductase [Bacillus sp. MB95]RCX29341.1 NAD(P)H dehydrogenase (quinone) [Bacil
MKICIVYDSEGGHTEALAKAIASGAELSGEATVYVKHVEEADVRELPEMDAIIWGCPGHFGTISSGLKTWIDKLGYLWAEGKLIDKVGAVFCTTATTHGGLEATLLNLITPMLHQGMVIAGLPGNIPENALYGTYYGVGITCPIEGDELLTENDQALGKALGERVVQVTKRMTQGQ